LAKTGLFVAQPEHIHKLTSRVARPRLSGWRAVLFAGAMLLPGCAPHTPPIHTFSQPDVFHVQAVSNLEIFPMNLVHTPAMDAVTAPANEPIAEAGPESETAAAPVSSLAKVDASVRAQMPPSASPYVPMIEAAAARRGISPNLLTAALARESANFRERYVRGYHVDGTGRGMAGIDKGYHPEVSDEQAMDPEYSINWMANELAGLIRKHGGDAFSAVREYNGGPNFASERIGYNDTPVSELTRRHAEAIFSYAGFA
jgi:soluble lytic murein transglycosylase-like protein